MKQFIEKFSQLSSVDCNDANGRAANALHSNKTVETYRKYRRIQSDASYHILGASRDSAELIVSSHEA